MKRAREEVKAKKEPKKPTKKQQKQPEAEPENNEEEDDEELTPEQKKMQTYFASIKDPKERMKAVREYVISQRENIRKKVESRK